MKKQRGRWYVLAWDNYCHRMVSDSVSLCGNQVSPPKCWKQWDKDDFKNHRLCPDCLDMLPGSREREEKECQYLGQNT